MEPESTLTEQNADTDPFRQFARWYDEALAAGLHEPTAMALATTDEDGRPSARMVLLKGYDRNGFVFYTNVQSRKATDLEEVPYAALLFWWDRLYRQIRIEGRAVRVTDAEADAYFASRPRGSQISAWASPQSTIIPHRAFLEERCAELEARYAGREVPRPPFWSGYRIVADYFEFWQGRANRLHDRLVYRLEEDGNWLRQRLAP